MSKDLFNENDNKLEFVLGLKEKSDLEKFYERPCEWIFHKIPKREQTPDLVQFAVKNDGIAIKSVSKKLITMELCETAVKQNGRALSYIPESILKDKR